MSIPDFSGAFYFYETETLTDYSGRDLTVERQGIGNLALPTGCIVACDGLIPSLEPFIQRVTPGTYSVTLSMASLDYNYWTAAAMVRFSDMMPKSWKPAVTTKQNSNRGYGVDTARGCFADLAAMEILLADEEKYKELQERVYQPNSDWTDFRLDGTCNIIVFSSGEGDGVYPSYFGCDADNNIVCLATDFGIIAPLPDKETEEPNKSQLKLDF